MSKADYAGHEALDPFFKVIQKGLKGLVEGEHYYDTIADNALFEFRYRFPGWPKTIRGRDKLIALYAGYGDSIQLRSADGLVVYSVQGGQVVILEYDIHGKILSTGRPYENRFVSIITIKNKKITHWKDYMDSLAAWRALNGAS